MYQLTRQIRTTMRIDLQDWEGLSKFAEYERVKVGAEKRNYKVVRINKCISIKYLLQLNTYRLLC